MDIKEIYINMMQIFDKLSRLQSDVDCIKAKLSLEDEMKVWENISIEDNVNFFKENDL